MLLSHHRSTEYSPIHLEINVVQEMEEQLISCGESH